MKTIIYKAEDRGRADHGWLKARHTFSFANHYDPAKIQFGLLRVLNDDVIGPGMGFGAHPHDNMEIVTIPLAGSIKHKDSMGNEGVIKAGEVQAMSAGTGVTHSEHNASATEALNLFQIWVFPKVRGIKPRYDQKAFDVADRKDKFQLLVSPGKEEGTIWINQDAWFSLGNLSAGKQLQYAPKLKTNGVFVMVVEGEITVNGELLQKRDAIGLSEIELADITANSDAEVLILDIPMN